MGVTFAAVQGGERAYYEIAATLIPLLLFGGVVFERVKPPDPKYWTLRHHVIAPLLIIFCALAILAEAAAINAVVVGAGTTATLYLVTLVLILGMMFVIAVALVPWLQGWQKTEHRIYEIGLPVSTVVLGALVFAGAGLLLQSPRTADLIEQLTEASEDQKAASKELKGAERNLESVELERVRIVKEIAIARARMDRPSLHALKAQRAFVSNLARSARSRVEGMEERLSPISQAIRTAIGG